MSTHKFATPQTAVVGAKPKMISGLNGPEHEHGLKEPLRTAGGEIVGSKPLRPVPLFVGGHVLGVQSHWINEAARRRCGGDMTMAKPNELVQVPHSRGLSARVANEMRSAAKRNRRRTIMQRVKDAVMERMTPKEANAPA